MPDEQSNLNLPASERRPSGNRRRGRRGGRGRSRGPRPASETNAPDSGENPVSPETQEPPIPAPAELEPVLTAEAEAENTGGFREPHPEAPEGFASDEAPPTADIGEAAPEEIHSPEAEPEPEPVAEAAPVPPPSQAPESRRDDRREHRRDDRREERRDERPSQPPPRIPVSQRPWTKPADFRPAAPTAIAQAVEHATFIAEALKELHDQMDEILELVEVAERQKLADERELDELRRALRRVQPQRQQPPPPAHHSHHSQQRYPQPRRDEPRRQAPEPRVQHERRAPEPVAAAPAPAPEPETPPAAEPTEPSRPE